jgi:thiamine-phosphate pyrophosphorylase
MLRLIDANLDRVGEGLRVLEDIARFLLNDATISGQLKTMRHELLGVAPALRRRLLSARKSGEDVAAFAEVPDEIKRANLPEMVMANAKRVEQSLRVIEEYAKLPTSELDGAKFKRARFALYQLEQELAFKLARREKRDKLVGLYVILDTDALRGRGEVEVTRKAISGGSKIIQLRDKHRPKAVLLTLARELKEVCSLMGAMFIVNDYVDVATACDADGVHLGQTDLPISIAREIVGPDKIIGCSTATEAEAVKAQADGADYISVGSIYPTSSKADWRLAGLETLRRVEEAVSVPLVAIGGINESNISQVVEAGVKCVAVIDAVLGTEDVEWAARRLVNRMTSFPSSRAR